MSEVVNKSKKSVIFAFPGKDYSGDFLMMWSDCLMKLSELGYRVALANNYSAYVPFTRMMNLGLNILRGADQKPYDGKVDYDVWVTIDSDIIFSPKQVIELIEDTDKYPVISGTYRMMGMDTLSAVKEWDTAYFIKNGSYKYLGLDELDKDVKHHEVVYTGMGFFACTREVLEKLEHPYFNYPHEEIMINGKNVIQVFSEDVSFCKRITDAGFKIWVNVDLRVGHEKRVVI